jgi:hypothetical protein
VEHVPAADFPLGLDLHSWKRFTEPRQASGEGVARVAFIYRIHPRMPPALFRDLLSRRDLAVVILEHLDYLYRLRGRQTPLGRAAWALSRLGEPGELGAASPLSQTGG